MADTAQLNAGLRHVYTAAGTALTIGTLLAVIPQESVQPTLDALHQMGDGLQQVFGGASKLVTVLGPVVVAFATKYAVGSASFRSRLAGLVASVNAPDKAVEKAALVAAVDQVPGVAAAATAPEVQAVMPSS